MASDPNADIQKHPVDARQGTDKPKLIYVLVGGVILVILAFFLAYLIGAK